MTVPAAVFISFFLSYKRRLYSESCGCVGLHDFSHIPYELGEGGTDLAMLDDK